MTLDDELSADSRALLRRARGADEPDRADISLVLHGFAERVSTSRAPVKRASQRKPFAFALAALALTASVGAFAKWGENIAPSLFVDTETDEDVVPNVDLDAPKQSKRVRRNASPELDSVPSSAPPEVSEPDFAEPRAVATFEVLPEAAQKPSPVADDIAAPGRAVSARVRSGAVVAASPPPVSRAAPAPAPSSLSGELELIARARDALSARDYQTASALAEQHARAYPRGVLGHERSAIAALAQCRAGRGPTLGQRFISRWPDSPFAAVVMRDCALLNPQPEPPGSLPGGGSNVVPERR
jgi:hypothetical protein